MPIAVLAVLLSLLTFWLNDIAFSGARFGHLRLWWSTRSRRLPTAY